MEAPNIYSGKNKEYPLLIPSVFWWLQILKLSYFKSTFLAHPSKLNEASPEMNPKNSPILIPETTRSTYNFRLGLWG